MKRIYCTYLIAALLAVASCSFNTPSIALVKKQRIYSYNRQGTLTERLAVFILLEDEDGRNDYKELTVREDATGLEWSINRENTVFLQETGYSKNAQWVGSNKLMYPRRFFPAGDYSLQAPQTVPTLPFEFMLKNEQWTLHITDDAVCSFFSLIMLSADLQPLTVYRLQMDGSEQKNGSLEALENRPADARYIQCFGEHADQSIGFLSMPIPLP